MIQFNDRYHAGKALAKELKRYKNPEGVMVVGLPTSFEAAFEVAHELDVPLDVVVALDIPDPSNANHMVGAVTHNSVVFDDFELAKIHLTKADRLDIERRQQGAARDIEHRLRGTLKKPNPINKNVIVVDDGMTGPLLMRAVLSSVEQHNPAKIILACPVITNTVSDACRPLVQDIVSLDSVNSLDKVRSYYKLFTPVEEAHVHALLEKSRKG